MVIANTRLRNRVNIAALLGILFSAYLNAIVTALSADIIVEFSDGTSYYALSWNLFYLFGAISMPISGRISGLYGKKRVYICGILSCLVGSVYASTVQSMAQFATSRCLTGFGYGIILSVGVAVLGEVNPAETRAKYVAFYSTMIGIGQVVFPPLASLMAAFYDWRLAFAAGAILGGVSAFMLWRYMPASPKPVCCTIDWPGISLLTLSCSALVLAVNGPGTLLPKARAWHCAAAAIILGFAFVLVERGKDCAVIPLRLFKNRIILLCALAVFGLYIAFYPLNTFKSILGTGVLGLSPVSNSVLMSVQFIGMSIFSILSGRLVAHTNRLKLITISSLSVTLIGFAGLIFTSTSTSIYAVGIYYFCIGAGTGHLTYAFTLFLQNNLPPEDVGIAIGTNGFLQKIGGTLGNSFANLAFIRCWIHASAGILSANNLSGAVFDVIRDYAFLLKAETAQTACTVLESAGVTDTESLLQSLRSSLASGIQHAWMVCAAGVLICLIVTLFLPKGNSPMTRK